MTQQTDFRSICAELVHIANALDGKNALISNQGQAMDGYSALAAFRDVADRARAALAAEADGPAVPDGREPASVVGEPSDEELLELAGDWPATTGPRHDLSGCPEVLLYSVFADEVVEFARAVLARYGYQPAPPAEGEVAELVALIRQIALTWEPDACLLGNMTAGQLARAADLLERQAAPVPVAVSERLPEAGDCLGRPTEDSDAGWCWTYSGALEVWRFQSVVFPRSYPEPPRVTLSPSVTHWLPHHALPLPQGEVE